MRETQGASPGPTGARGGGPFGSSHTTACGAEGEVPSSLEGGTAGFTCAFCGSPPTPTPGLPWNPKATVIPGHPGALLLPQALPRGVGPAVSAGMAEGLARGTGREKDLLDLGH